MDINPCYTWTSKKNRQNNKLFPASIRALVVGKSNCGKTTLMLNLLLKPGWLDYDHLYIFGNSLHQKEYKILKAGLEAGLSKEQITNIFENQSRFGKVDVFDAIAESTINNEVKLHAEFYDDCRAIPDPCELSTEKKKYFRL